MSAKNVAMIPARLGSQRLKHKNLREINGCSIIGWAIRKCIAADCFDEIWVNTETDLIGEIALNEGAQYHKRPAELANNVATSEQFVHEFLTKHECEYLFQVHSIAPMLTAELVRQFVAKMNEGEYDSMLSYTPEQIECAMNDKPLNFSYDSKTNSQDLIPIQRITWSITAWRAAHYLAAFESGKTATYAGKVGYYPIDRSAGIIIKNEEDFQIVAALWELRNAVAGA